MRVNSIGLRLNYTNSWGNRLILGRSSSKRFATVLNPMNFYFNSFNKIESIKKYLVISKFSIFFFPKKKICSANIRVYTPLFSQFGSEQEFKESFIFNRVFSLIDYIIYTDLNRVTNFKNCRINYIFINKYFTSAYLISDYITKELANKFKLSQIIKNVATDMDKFNHKKAYIIHCSGRFDRKERASFAIFSKGRLSRSTYKTKLSYFNNEIALQYGVCGIKVWIGK